MALFGQQTAYLGLDIGTSSLKMVELINRRKRIEVATYAEANLPNLLVNPSGDPEDAARRVANTVMQMADKAGVSTDAVIAALPSGTVFSTVLKLPNLPDKDLDQAVHFAARDVVPADLDDMILGWSKVGDEAHMDSDTQAEEKTPDTTDAPSAPAQGTIPVFLTAAPKEIVNRYTRMIELTNFELVALEVETFSLVRSLLEGTSDSAMIIDIGDQVTTYHLIDKGTVRLSYTIEVGGNTVTEAVAQAGNLSREEAHAYKVQNGLADVGDSSINQAMQKVISQQVSEGDRLLEVYANKESRQIKKVVLIGGGAKLRGLDAAWGASPHRTVVMGNPWRGLSYPKEVTDAIQNLGPTFGVAVGLAQRGVATV